MLLGERYGFVVGRPLENIPLDGIDRPSLASGEFDLIAVGRALLGDPQWVTKIRSGDQSELKDFNPATLAELF